ncbi:MAG: 5-guanidino-2-oxopentanoate decarboxylase [Candidatus Pacebacteria bacterium]|nr:5-guanidino-2-oxopentanoate decarboxylase [Candidatus Paceibacterota bacterium]
MSKTAPSHPSVGTALPIILEAYGVDTIFGIPGVHTVELYRGLPETKIRHITPRHEQGAGFMADGYARMTGKPGVTCLITGPGLTNCLTAMAQAAADSIPMLILSGVNRVNSLGHGHGLLHELADQAAVIKSVVRWSHTLLNPNDLGEVIARAFAIMASERPGPVHIEIPTDVMKLDYRGSLKPRVVNFSPATPAAAELAEAVRLLTAAKRPLILAGGGAVWGQQTPDLIRKIAEHLDAPVVTTINGRGIMAGHRLGIPASPSLPAVRELMVAADVILALGTEFGQTDYDFYEDDGMPSLPQVIQVDVSAAQLMRTPAATVALLGGVEPTVAQLLPLLTPAVKKPDWSNRASVVRSEVEAWLSPKLRSEIAVLQTIQRALPRVIIVGDSTQPVYSGNIYFDVERVRGWFNAATGYGTLGYAPGAAIGAAIGAAVMGDRAPVVCLVGDGGLQFSLGELGSAVDAGTPVIFIVWNSEGFLEIENFMIAKQIHPEGVRPVPPDFMKLAEAYRIPSERVLRLADLTPALARAAGRDTPSLIEIVASETVFG